MTPPHPRVRLALVASLVGLAAGGLACMDLFATPDLPPDVLPGDDPPPPQDAVEDPAPSAEGGPWVRLIPATPSGPLDVGPDAVRDHCQPETFVPEEVTLEQAPPPRRTYQRIVGDDSHVPRFLTVSDWERGVSPPDGMRLQRWDFLCDPNTEDTVLEVRQDGGRKALFTHVERLSASPDGRVIYMVNVVRRGESWVRRARLIDLHAWKVTDLGVTSCTGFVRAWKDGLLVTSYGDPEWDDDVDVCVWDTASGEQLAHVQYPTDMMQAATVTSADPLLIQVQNLTRCRVAMVDVAGRRIRERRLEGSFPACIGLDDDLDPLPPEVAPPTPKTVDSMEAFEAWGRPLPVR